MIVAGTGHRPDKLGGYTSTTFDWLRSLCLNELHALKPSVVISGMAQGFDQALAEAAVHLKIPFLAYVPFTGQEDIWPEEAKVQYRNLLRKAEEVIIVCSGEYAGWKMRERNRRMVKDCSTLLALWNGDTSGGTFNCVQYAMKVNRKIENCWMRWTLLQKQV